MFVSKKRWQSLIKRIADLEVQVQSQQGIMIGHIKSDDVFNDEMRSLIQKGLNAHASLCE